MVMDHKHLILMVVVHDQAQCHHGNLRSSMNNATSPSFRHTPRSGFHLNLIHTGFQARPIYSMLGRQGCTASTALATLMVRQVYCTCVQLLY